MASAKLIYSYYYFHPYATSYRTRPADQLIQRFGYPNREQFAKQVLEEGPHHLLAALFDQQAWRRYVVRDGDSIEMARCHQAATLFHVSYLLDDPCFDEVEVDDVAWSLLQTDQNGAPFGHPIEGTHELVLGSDPTGREMRPNDA